MTTVDGAEPAGPRRTHRLLSEADIRARFRPAVADYLLAVRGELVVRFGEVDTYRRFAAELGSRVRHPTQTDLRKLARRRADHFNNAAGPPWRTVEEVLRYVVPAERQSACREQFTALYTAARGEPPPGPGNADPVDGTEPDANPKLTRNDMLMIETAQLYVRLGNANEQLHDAQEELARLEASQTALRIRLAGRVYEIDGLRHRLHHLEHGKPPTARGVAAVQQHPSWLPEAAGSDIASRFASIAERLTASPPIRANLFEDHAAPTGGLSPVPSAAVDLAREAAASDPTEQEPPLIKRYVLAAHGLDRPISAPPSSSVRSGAGPAPASLDSLSPPLWSPAEEESTFDEVDAYSAEEHDPYRERVVRPRFYNGRHRVRRPLNLSGFTIVGAVRLIHRPASAPVGVGHLRLAIGDHEFGQLRYQVCHDCCHGRFVSVETDRLYQHRGFRTRLVSYVVDRHPTYTWCTTTRVASLSSWRLTVKRVGVELDEGRKCQHILQGLPALQPRRANDYYPPPQS